MNYSDLKLLVDYHYWARDRVLSAVDSLPADQFTRDMGNSFKSIRDTLAHTFGAESIWCSRWRGESPTSFISAETFPDAASIRKAWQENESKVRGVLEQFGESGIERVIEYKAIDGKAFSSVFWHMLQHVVNHASYHRGQVTTMLRQLGAAPPKSMDMITFQRERGL